MIFKKDLTYSPQQLKRSESTAVDFRWTQNSYAVGFLHLKVLEFDFTAIQLNQLDWRDYLDRSNPVAAALMSKMRIEKKDRPKVKAECLRLLVTLKLDPAKSRLISKFVDSYSNPKSVVRIVAFPPPNPQFWGL